VAVQVARERGGQLGVRKGVGGREEHGLPPTLRGLLDEPRLAGARVIVIDDGSTDKTADVAARFAPRVQVLRHKRNQGYGAGIKTGTRHATTRWVAWFDADGQHRTEDLVALFETAVAEQYDAVLGNRSADSAIVKSARSDGRRRSAGCCFPPAMSLS
jgi:glycosyltransferase involved in cell wall biosynthesis